MKTWDTTWAFGAVGGLLAGLGGCDRASGTTGVTAAPAQGTAAAPAVSGSASAKPKDCCVGKNECKGKGGCRTDANACKGKNECKGKGGCGMRDCS